MSGKHVVVRIGRHHVDRLEFQVGKFGQHVLSQLVRRSAPLLLMIHIQRNDDDIVRVRLLQLQKLRKFRKTVASPQRPEIEDDEPALLTGNEMISLV